jgi:hypothetical protein
MIRVVVLGTTLGLVRPYDLVLAVLVHASGLVRRPAADYWPGLRPLLGLVPVAAYNYWVFYLVPTFGTYAATSYAMPPTGDFVFGLGPAMALALRSIGRRPADDFARAMRVKLWVWAAVVGMAVVWRPVPFTQQFVIGGGFPLLLLAALGLARFRPAVLAGVALASSTTAFVALRIVTTPDPNWFVPVERRAAALALRGTCGPGSLVMAPPDIGLFAIGLSACRAFVSHNWAPRHEERLATVRAFYETLSPPERRTLLDRTRVTHLVLPGETGIEPSAWLGEGSTFRRVAEVGSPPRAVGIYARATSR